MVCVQLKFNLKDIEEEEHEKKIVALLTVLKNKIRTLRQKKSARV